jgi:hypothetical protein
MTRLCTTAAIIAFSTSYAHAGTYNQVPDDQVPAEIHDFAVAACAPESGRGELPRSHYGAIENHCVYRISHSDITRDQAIAKAENGRQFASK